MSFGSPSPLNAPRLAFLAAFAAALGFAWFTQHVWEDYYITFRSSRNLAGGNGLVFNVGDKLHTFTSPLGVLLPAGASYVTGGRSDAAALWIFRVLSAAALGGAAWLLVRALARTAAPWLGALLPAAWLITDAKTLDFTINGMETAFMLLFLAYTVWAHLQDTPRRWLHLGLAWSGLMWTRPDSFIYGVLWLVPRLPAFARAASFAFFGTHVYLTFFPYFPFPWYIPNTAILAALALGGLVAALAATRSAVARGAAAGLALLLVGGEAWLSGEAARQTRVQQQFVEEAGRRKIGEWLKDNARPGDTVFMEPLGYIGYFSGLKTYDFPGMSSREMVEARRIVGNEWAQIIAWLQPTFVVLRPHEVERVKLSFGSLLDDNYARVAEFNVLPQVRTHDVLGRAYLEHDSHFLVFRLQRPTRYDTRVAEIRSEFPPSDNLLEGIPLKFLHAPTRLAVVVPERARSVRIHYGFSPNCWEQPNATDGADFIVEYIDGARRTPALARTLQPTENLTDRALQRLDFELPAGRGERPLLLIRIDTRGNKDKDWTNLSIPEFR